MTDIERSAARTRRINAVPIYTLMGIGAMLALALAFSPGPDIEAVFGSKADALADYFKFILSFPGGRQIAPGSLFGLTNLVLQYQIHNPYHGAGDLPANACSHFLVPPLTTLFCLINLAAMRFVEPVLCFTIVLAGLLTAWVAIAMRALVRPVEGALWCLAGVMSYPFLLMILRGNVYAGMAALAIIAAMLLSAGRRAPIAAALLLAIAVNFRPNAIILLPAMLLVHRGMAWRMLAVFTVAGGAIFGLCLLGAHALYPGYTLATFRAGLRIYYQGYVVKDAGLAMGSSLFGAIKFFMGYHPGLDLAALLPALGIMAAALVLGISRSVSAGVLIFLFMAAYCLGSTVIADYHLFVFIAPAMLLARERQPFRCATPEGIAFLASCLMLVPLNYVFSDGISWQVVLHPAALLLASLAILIPALRAFDFGRLRATVGSPLRRQDCLP